MSLENKRKLRSEGDQLVDLINDQVFAKQLTGVTLANELGKSEAQISFVLNPLHQSQFTLPDLPVLMRLLDGKAIARVICGWINQLPIDIPNSKAIKSTVGKEVGEVLIDYDRAVKDGKIDLCEATNLRAQALDVLGAIETAIVELSEQL